MIAGAWDFVAETENQVCEHLEDHLQKLPESDEKSKAILEQMIIDERQHGETAKRLVVRSYHYRLSN